MYIASIDCGTTNTRVYIIDESACILGKGVRKVGVRDTSISGSRELLKEGLKEAFFDALSSANLRIEDVSFAISAGMITSEIGLLEIPHLWAPAGVDDLAAHLVKVHDLQIFPINLPIYFIPGIKNLFNPETISMKDINSLDFMRGEEAQSAGILRKRQEKKSLTFVMLSSHTKFIPINAEGKILGSITTLSGQIYEALKTGTLIGKSLKGDEADEPANYFDEKIINSAFTCIAESGFLRSLMMIRFMDVLISSKWYERKLFIESAIAAEDMKVIERFESLGFPVNAEMIFIGGESRCRIYKHILMEQFNWKSEISYISNMEEIDQLNIQGALYIAEKARILE
jgi:2-dehydro-3-deoxygalactonokinase